MHGLCKYRPTMNTSSLVLSITASVHIASRTARFLSFLSSRRNALSFHEALVFCSFDDVFSSSGFGPSSPRTGSCFSLSLQVSAAAYHRFISKRGLKGDERKAAVRNPSGTPPSGPSSKKDGVIESRCLPSNLEGSLKSARTQFDNHRESLTRGNGPLYPDQSQESGSLEHEQKVSTISRLDNFDMFDEEINDEDDEDFGNEDLDDKEYEDVADELMDLDGIEDHDGGEVNISHTAWGQEALLIAREVVREFGDNFSLYAFKASFENRIYVRLDKHSDRYGSPTMIEIESFSNIYGKRLEEARQDGDVPGNISLEVSSPGAERVIKVPDQLMRFKGLPMLVKYEEVSDTENARSHPVLKDCILELMSLDTESGKSVWKLANVRANREQAGKGRGLTKKQRECRMVLPLSSLRLVRLYMDI
ncbi:hypothetical protein KP509_28G059800 [Ceratopteris richardii]|uniref:DUF7912 domain-containing protein n=1 Tax=Ceratopteris richardii TaxID=49495 RepID=A0A8T2RF59_CERRI|nr:hypothetical protein KP509_28G059800 [Ceratopteris richardii]